MNNNLINREKYIKKLEPFINKQVIKVLTGQRRVGKSYILKQLIKKFRAEVGEKNIIYINKEDSDFDSITNYDQLNKYIENKIKESDESKKIYLLIDEVQEIDQFEKSLRSFLLRERFDIYITGSNSKIVSSEISTFLSGRYIEIKVFPLTFVEFIEFNHLDSSDDSLLKYINYGGMPFIKNLQLDQDIVFEYLRNIYNTIILKDVVERFKLRDTIFLNKLVEYIAFNVGSVTSSNNIVNFLINEREISTNPQSVISYVDALESTYFINKADRYDVVGKKALKLNSKYYFTDIGIRNLFVKDKILDISKSIENLVYNEFLSRGYKVYTGYVGEYEIDFVIEFKNQRKYVQVCYVMSTKETREREFGSLLKIRDSYPRFVISMDRLTSDYEGIRHVALIDFLLDQTLI